MADKDLKEIRNLCITKIGKCADNVLKYLENDKEAEIENLRSHIKHYCLYEEYPNVIEQVSKEIKNVSNLDDIENTFHECFNIMVNKIAVDKHPWMIELEEKIVRGLGIAENWDVTDSFTKKPIQNPVMNKHCRHVYEKENILKHIKLGKATSCPLAGCGNKQPLQQVDLLSEIDTRCILNQPSTSNGVPVYDVDMDSP